MKITRLSILGVGLLGGSIGMAVKSLGTPCHVKGYGHRHVTLKRALLSGAIDQACDSVEDAVRDTDLVILCTPVGLFEVLLARMARVITPETIVTDVGSTKRSIVRLASALLPNPATFVGSHPMAGSEKRGVEFARADLFQGARCILTPTDETDPLALETVNSFWQDLGMRTVLMSPDEHDRLVCQISHLPHALAAAIVAMQTDAALDLAGMGFIDTTRVAGGDAILWRDIFLDNRDYLAESLRRLRLELDKLQQMLDMEQSQQLQQWLEDAARRRNRLLESKLRELHPD